MNKKVFTLLAASLMLFVTAFMASAQTLYYGDAVKYLPAGVGKGAYHLKVTIGSTVTDKFLAMDELGYITLVDPATYIYGAGVKPDSAYRRLRASMWCVNVIKPENYGKVPGFSFVNKEYGADLEFKYNQGESFSNRWLPGLSLDSIASQSDLPLVGGELGVWKFSRTYNTVPLEQEQYLAIEVKPDYYMTFAKKPGVDSIRLVVAHKDEFDKNADFYNNDLLKFTLVSAVPRVLTAKEFNTMMYEYSTEEFRQLEFAQKVSKGQVNPFEQPLKAEEVTGTTGNGLYLNLKNQAGEYVTVVSAKEADYVNDLGYRFPKIVTGKKSAAQQSDWRLVYYPSEDSLVINVRSLKHIEVGDHADNGTYLAGEYDNLFNQEIWNFLTVRMQDLAAGERVITVRNKPADVRGFFNINSCVLYDKNRTTVKSDLYTIRDKDGRYLVVPMYAGSFTPQWLYLDENEVANMTPSCQWFVFQANEGSEISKIHLVNREFDDIRIEYVQIYKNYEPFNGIWWRFDPNMKKKDYSPVMGKYLVNAESFTRVPKPYRNDPYLGYKFFSRKPSKKNDPNGGIQEALDSLNWFAYSFHWLSGLTKNGYLGFEDKASPKDTLLYVLDNDPTYFELVVPDTLRKEAYGTERYGMGWKYGYPAKFTSPSSDDYIAPLERWFYHLKVNDYWKYKRYDNYVVLDGDGSNGRYGYTKEEIANARKLNKAKFYLRFTYRVNGTDYYTLIDRIDIANFHYYTEITNLRITDTVRVHDNSHGTVLQNSFGAVQATVEGLNRYVGSMPKTLGGFGNYTFALSHNTEPLYRRFNTTDESAVASDNPDTLKFYRANVGRPRDYLYEDAHSDYSQTIKPIKGQKYSSINFLGVQNEDRAIANKHKDQVLQRHLDTDWAIYVDTAYVNRGTGHIKPQYMLVVDPQFGNLGCPKCGEYFEEDERPYVYGRYLRNQTDSARLAGHKDGKIVDPAYIWESKWERLSFTPAIHAGDTLYILNGYPIDSLYQTAPNGKKYVNYKKLYRNKKIAKRFLGNNLHKDEVFSFRFKEIGGGLTKNFLIESETTNRNAAYGRMIAPMDGGWIKIQNGVPVISRGSFSDNIEEAEVWNVKMTDKAPVANAQVSATDVKVVAGAGAVTVLNASGKKVTVSNILGQTIAKVVLTSDNETIAAPQGVVVVAIEGEKAVKAVVK